MAISAGWLAACRVDVSDITRDHYSAEYVGTHAHARATRFEAPKPIRLAVRRHFAEFAKGLAVRHDHGSQYMSDHFQNEIAFRETYNTAWLIERHGFLTPVRFRHE